MTTNIGPRERLFVAQVLSTELAVLESGRCILAQRMEIAQHAIIQHLRLPDVGQRYKVESYVAF